MKKLLLMTTLAGLAATGMALADPIEGNWTTESGQTAAIGKCGGDYCITLTTGDYAGKRIGQMTGSDGRYRGTVTDPADDATYSGSAKVTGTTLRLKGCAFIVVCQTQHWKKQ